MKKHALAFVLFCITAGSIHAQKVKPGIMGGLNSSDITGFDGDNRLSGHVGLFLHSRLNANWAIQPEFLYSGQGQHYMVVNNEHTIAINYLQVPLMFQFYPVRQFYLQFGPELSFLIAAHDKDEDDNKVEIDEYYRKVDLGLGLGAGVQATDLLGFYVRYNAGLTDITKRDNRDHYNRFWQIGASIRFK